MNQHTTHRTAKEADSPTEGSIALPGIINPRAICVLLTFIDAPHPYSFGSIRSRGLLSFLRSLVIDFRVFHMRNERFDFLLLLYSPTAFPYFGGSICISPLLIC